MKRILLLWIGMGATALFAQVTKVGNDTLLDVGCWNVEWFGDATNGPSNEALQYTNVKSVLKQTELDVWGLAEVSSSSTFSNILTDVPTLDGFLSTFSQTQKTALLWKKSMFQVISAANVLTESMYNYDFAGRPPLEVVLRTINAPVSDTISFYVVHLKANSGSGDQSSYDRRKKAAGYLKGYLDVNKAGKKVVVLGDWNDDVDQSVVYISPAYLETPFKNFIADSNRYFFPTKALSLAGENSYVSSQNMIDHQLISRSLQDSFYIAGSSLVMKTTAAQISGYASNTSDHYPILTSYNLNRKLTEPVDTSTVGVGKPQEFKFVCYPNPANHQLVVESSVPVTFITLFDLAGVVHLSTSDVVLDVSGIASGMYFIEIKSITGAVSIQKLSVNH
jgi:exonuclease III